MDNLPEDMRERVRHIIVDPTGNEISTSDVAVGFRSSTDVQTMISRMMSLLEEVDRKARIEEMDRLELNSSIAIKGGAWQTVAERKEEILNESM